MTTATGTNGNGNGTLNAAAFLREPLTADYRPAVVGLNSFWVTGQRSFFTLWDVEAMRRDPQIKFGLWILGAPLLSTEVNGKRRWTVEGNDPEVQQFIDQQALRFWGNELSKPLKM